MNHRTRLFLSLLLVLLLFALAACGETPPEPTPTPNPGTQEPSDNPNPAPNPGTQEPSDNPNPTPNPEDKKTFTGIAFPDKTVTYDGTEHALAITGTLPDGTSVSYENEKGTNAGTYAATVTVSKEGYTTLSLNATLTINKADFTGITFQGKTVTYDGAEHALAITGTMPDGASVSYENEKGTNAGTYAATATLSRENYNTKVLNATLTIEKANFTGITFQGKTVTYDGTEHVLAIAGTLPDGASVSYENEKGTNAGTYAATATLSRENYNTKILNATLTINKADIPDGLITFSDAEVEYDGLSHSLVIVGAVPNGCSVVYTYNGETRDSVTAGGDYTVVATVSGQNHNARQYTAKLTIKTTEKQLWSVMIGNVVYFQNPLDNDTLYKYADGTLTKIGNDEANYLTAVGNDLYFTSKGLLSSNIKKLTTAQEVSTSNPSAVYSANAQYLAVSDEYLYFAVNSLLGGEKNGIYRYSLSAEDDTLATQIYKGNASWLCVYGSSVYFAAGSSKGKLCSIPTAGGAATEYTSDLLTDRNITEMIINGSTLYLNIGSATKGYALHRIDLPTSTITKLTCDAGKNLTVIGNTLYYVNSDLLTSSVFGKGVYKVLTGASGSLPGMKIVDEQVYSLTGDGTKLYYYRHANKHLMCYNLSDDTATDIMADFIPVDNTYVMGYAETKEYGGEIYYINNRDGGAIYKYNPMTKGHFKVIADACADFWFHDGYMYYSKYVLTNYDLYKLDMKGGSDPVRVSKNRIDALTFDGDYIYFVDNGATANRIRRVPASSLDFDTDAVQVGKDNVNYRSLFVLDGKLYYCTNPTVGYKNFCSIDINNFTDKTAGTKIGLGEMFTFVGGKFYVYNQKDKTVYSYDPTTGAMKNALATKVEIVDMVNDGTNVYYASNTSGSEGLYKFDIRSNTSEKVYTGAVDGLGSTSKGITFVDVKITYASEMPVAGGVAGEGYLYLYDGETTKSLNKPQ